MNNTNNALETLVQRDKQIKKTNDKLKASINELDAELETTTNAISTHASNTDIHTPIATIEGMIDTKVSSLVNSAPETLDTLKELSDALGNDPNFATTIATQIGSKANSVHNHVVSDITDFPTIPTKLSQLENDMGFGIGGDSGDTSDCVHKTGNETIDGTKTFTSSPWIINSQTTMGYFIKNTALARNEIPTEYQHCTFRAHDKNNNILGEYCIEKSTGGDTLLNMVVRSEDASGTQIAYGMQFRMTNDGSLVRFMPSANNKVHLGDVGAKWVSVHATNAHVTYTYTNRVTTYSITHPTDDSYFFVSGGTDYNKGATLYLGGVSATNFTPGRFALSARKTDGSSIELAGSPDGTLKWNNKNVAIDEDLVHTSGAETINGAKTFTNDISYKNSNLDLTVTPTSNTYANFNFRDKNNKTLSYLQYGKQTSGTGVIGLYLYDSNQALHGLQITSNNYVVPFTNNTYGLGSSSAKWLSVYATTFNGNLKGSIDSSTTATTQATSDNSTKIATTAWVRTYVDSVAGSNTVGSSVSAYWSNSSNVTATGQASAHSSSSSVYPACYSEYINKTPVVGTVYSGAQLYTVLNAYASAKGTIQSSGQYDTHITTVTAQATFSNPISPTGKYLCTTANTVKFRAYVTAGNSSTVGSASVVDNSSTKSIFIRVQ